MDARIKQMWIEALETYPQTQGVLKNDKGFCCFGVLCDLHSKETNTPWGPKRLVFSSIAYAYKGDTGLPDVAVLKWAGLAEWERTGRSKNAHALLLDQVDGSNESLITRNDEGQSFKRIARLIKEHF